MTPEDLIEIHEQKTLMSCSPWLIEAILKLEGEVGTDFYKLQKAYEDQQVGLKPFNGTTYGRLTFYQHDEEKNGPLSAFIPKELNAGRFLGLYVLNTNDSNFHGWIVAGQTDTSVLLLSRAWTADVSGNIVGQQKVDRLLPVADLKKPNVTDCVFYTKGQ